MLLNDFDLDFVDILDHEGERVFDESAEQNVVFWHFVGSENVRTQNHSEALQWLIGGLDVVGHNFERLTDVNQCVAVQLFQHINKWKNRL